MVSGVLSIRICGRPGPTRDLRCNGYCIEVVDNGGYSKDPDAHSEDAYVPQIMAKIAFFRAFLSLSALHNCSLSSGLGLFILRFIFTKVEGICLEFAW